MNKTILNDFIPNKRISYQDYTSIKGYPLGRLYLDTEKNVSKRGSNLYIEEEVFDLSEHTINGMFSILIERGVEVGFYKENIEDTLNFSALFVVDFETVIGKRFILEGSQTHLKFINSYTEGLSTYSLKSLKVVDEDLKNVTFKISEDILTVNLNEAHSAYITYVAVNLEIFYMKEYPLQKLSHFNLNRETT